MSSYARTHARRVAAMRARSHNEKSDGPSLLERWALPLVVAATLAAIIGAVLLTRGGGEAGGGGTPGDMAPDFSALDVVSGRTMSLSDLEGQKTLLFFSEGAACQACLVQAADLQKDPGLKSAGIQLVSVSTDPPDILAAAASQYGIKTPMLSDASLEMSRDYGMLGRGGMGHPDTDGHAFMLLDRSGRIVWEQEYAEMYVEPDELVAELPLS